MLAVIDWTNVLIALIAGAPGIIAALYGRSVHGQVQTPSGKPLGEVAEYAHDTAIANNLLLSRANGQTKTANAEQLHTEAQTPPQVPEDAP